MLNDIPVADDRVLTYGAHFTVSHDKVLTSSSISRIKAVLIGVLCLAGFATIIVLDQQQSFSQSRWFEYVADLSLPLLLIGLMGIGLYKRVLVSPHKNAIWQEVGWLFFNISPYFTSQWRLDRFDRIIIQRSNWLRMDAPVAGNTHPHAGKIGILFRVRLQGDYALTINAYTNYQHAQQLAHALARVTGYPIHDLA